jgi:hypothetical protein
MSQKLPWGTKKNYEKPGMAGLLFQIQIQNLFNMITITLWHSLTKLQEVQLF